MNRATMPACMRYTENFFAKNKIVDQNAEMRHVSGFLIFRIPPENLRDVVIRAPDGRHWKPVRYL